MGFIFHCDKCGRPLGTYLYGRGGVEERAHISGIYKRRPPDVICNECWRAGNKGDNMNAKENDCYCVDCKHYNPKEECCWLARDMFFNEDEHGCIYWEEAEPELTEEERYDGGCMSNFDNENPKEIEDYINETPV